MTTRLIKKSLKGLMVTFVILAYGCNGHQDKVSEASDAATIEPAYPTTVATPNTKAAPKPDSIPTDASQMAVHEVPLPKVPDTLQKPAERADYLLTHFWDALDFNNPDMMNDALLIEQTFANFVELLPRTSGIDVVEQAIGRLYEQASVNRDSYLTICRTAEKYLHDEASPLRNQALYEYFIIAMVKGNVLSDTQKRQYAAQSLR